MKIAQLLIWSPMWVIAALVGSLSHQADAHGVPIMVDSAGDQLIVSNGVMDPGNFGPMIFLDPSEDAQLDHVTLPNFGPVGLINLPGLDLRNLEPGSGLWLDFQLRPVSGSATREKRLLWFADGLTEEVSLAPNDQTMDIISEFGQVRLTQIATVTPEPLMITDVQPEDLGQHVHFLRYLFDDDPTAAEGAYGFFAQLTSPAYDSSDPFLVIFNNGLDADRLEQAAWAISAAARPACGDLDIDGDVDSGDLLVFLEHWTGADAARDPSIGWYDGDCDLDGDIDSSDLVGFLSAWTGALPSAAGRQLAGSTDQIVALPEGISIGWAALFAIGLLRHATDRRPRPA